jgi:hypothetical protein
VARSASANHGPRLQPRPAASAAGAKPAAADEGVKPNPTSAFWSMFREYGSVFVGYWTTCWVVCFVPIYGAIHFHVVPYDGMDVLYALGADSFFDLSKWSPQLVNAAVAFEANEFLDLLRLPVIIATTPRLARWLRKS